MKIRLLLSASLLFGMVSCEMHTDYDKIKAENVHLKKTIKILELENAQAIENERILREK